MEEGSPRLNQPVLLQSFSDEFELPVGGETPRTPATPGTVLQKGEVSDEVDEKEKFTYRSGVGKLLHMMKWTRPETLNSICELTRFLGVTARAHTAAMYRAMKYCVRTPNRGL
jgi:hypothetical protein